VTDNLAEGITEVGLRDALSKTHERYCELFLWESKHDISCDCIAGKTLSLKPEEAEAQARDIFGILKALKRAECCDEVNSIKVYKEDAPGLDYGKGSALYLQEAVRQACKEAGIE
jgi:hypothetical protein